MPFRGRAPPEYGTAAVEPCAQIVQHFMDQRTALVAQHEGVDRREQQLAPAGLAAEQYAAERLALPLAAEHLPGFDVLFLIVPFAPIRVAGVEQGGVGVAGGHHEAGNRLFGPFVEIERRKVLTVEQRVSAAYDVAGGIARSERHGVAAELFDQRKRRGRDVPYQQGASGAECGAEPFDEGRTFRRRMPSSRMSWLRRVSSGRNATDSSSNCLSAFDSGSAEIHTTSRAAGTGSLIPVCLRTAHLLGRAA